jgi:epimerase transport system membrane fusion protein
VQAAIDNERALFQARRAGRIGEIAVLEQKIEQLEQKIVGTTAVVKAKQSIVQSLEMEISDLNELLEDGYVDKQRIRQLDRTLAENLGGVAELQAQIAAAHVAAEEARLNIKQLTKRFITTVVDELTVRQDELFDLEQQYAAITDRVDRSTIRSPAAGYVMALEPNTAGAVIAPGAQLLEIVPDVGKYVIDVQMSPMDIDRIRIGQEAEVRFAVFKDSYTVTGELIEISADAILSETTGQTFYEAKVKPFDDDLLLLGDEKLVPGMPAEILVKTGSRTLLGYITSPLQRMFENALLED